MVRTLAGLVAFLLLTLPGCSKTPPGFSGTGAYKAKDPVWVTYGWSKGRMVYVIFLVPNPNFPVKEDGLAATLKPSSDPKVGDSFEGSLDGNLEKTRVPFTASSRTFDITIEKKPYRISNGPVFLINTGPPSKVEQLQAQIAAAPKDETDIPSFMENQVRKLVKENPKISEFPKAPEAPKPDKTKKK